MKKLTFNQCQVLTFVFVILSTQPINGQNLNPKKSNSASVVNNLKITNYVDNFQTYLANEEMQFSESIDQNISKITKQQYSNLSNLLSQSGIKIEKGAPQNPADPNLWQLDFRWPERRGSGDLWIADSRVEYQKILERLSIQKNQSCKIQPSDCEEQILLYRYSRVLVAKYFSSGLIKNYSKNYPQLVSN